MRNVRIIKRISIGPGSAARWLVAGAPGALGPEQVLAGLAERLRGEGVALAQASVFVTTLHPKVHGGCFTWRPGRAVEVTEVRYAATCRDDRESAFDRAAAERTVLRLRGAAAGGGFSEALFQPLAFLSGETHVAAWMTRRRGGFSPDELAALDTVREPLSRVAEIIALRRTSRNLLDTYLGRNTRGRVLGGAVHRGDSEELRAVIWFCDMRDSTLLAERLGHAGFFEVLNDYLDCVGGAVIDNGGEIVRFVGDAALAMFPLRGVSAAAERRACSRAVRAAREAMVRMEVLNGGYREQGRQTIDYGIGLHVGQVVYGNVGAGARLEFAVIGAAANEAARIESQCKRFGVRLVVSDRVAAAVPGCWRTLGRHALRGVCERRELFTLRRGEDVRAPGAQGLLAGAVAGRPP